MRSPLSDFTCPDLLEQETQVFFRETPLFMGLSSDLPTKNTYWADSKTGVPILMIRDEDRKFRAFANMCRHRGAQVVPDGRGVKDRFSCPFHAWTYNTKGDLIAINREARFGCVEKSDTGLVELPAAEKYGTLWVRPTPGAAIDVDDCLSGLQDDVKGWKLDKHTFARTQDIKARANWKLAVDTFGENYHFDVLHKNTLAPAIKSNLQTHDIYGRNYRMVFANQTFEEIKTHVPEGQEMPFRAMTLSVYYFYPNTIFLVDAGGCDVIRIFPDGPQSSITSQNWYMNPDAHSYFITRINEVNERFVGFNAIIQNEDYKVAETTQRTADSGILKEVIFGRNEPALHHYHNMFREGLGRERLPVELDESLKVKAAA